MLSENSLVILHRASYEVCSYITMYLANGYRKPIVIAIPVYHRSPYIAPANGSLLSALPSCTSVGDGVVELALSNNVDVVTLFWDEIVIVE